MRDDFLERGDAARIAFDRDHVLGAERQQGSGQSARPRPDLDHGDVFERGGGAGDAGREIEIEQKVLPERLARAEAVAADEIPQRRQRIDPSRHRGAAAAAAGAPDASRAARRNAAMRLDGSARPVPAMSKAVPWSGEVRTNGRPSVTFTASAKARVLIGMRAWSWYMHKATS